MNASDQQVPHRRTVVSYVQRGERMTSGQQRAWDRYWTELGSEISSLPEGPLDATAWFDRDAPLVLEIGSGMGETTAQLAADQPAANHVAIEVYKPGLAQLLLRAETLGVDNLRLLRGDAVVLLREHIEPGALSEVRIFFPDPWPKKRHHKRRLVQPDTVELIASRLVHGGVLHLATDWSQYAEQMLEICTAQGMLRNLHPESPDGWAPRPPWRPVTKFEQRAHEEGRVIHDLLFERV
ncbi:tRNA (guanosine(46)-N7)-methyltransferase TrmB [Haloactinomyces albus]|uniref:tRNA (guanine-N(7)-)-methyltransferase n=1 Tax=Haloactinomyces albus TaxID=1352928 RepID=A0AAE3ZE19_9ACTN|nr:tRNA (guanosine(46)-N7)-methyltransferase TrmB [Haloactinomyces albus]MDR7302116.1 tRNA (guanine-N7-)-methyltransferase [Haloactinomyces albus]